MNTIVVTLYEKTTLDPVNYLFAFKGADTNNYTYCLAGSNTSTATQRYDRFEIEEKTGADPEASEVELPEGQYSYSVYELSDAQLAALDFNDVDVSAYGLVEGPGIARVYDATNNLNTEYESSSTNTVYE